MILVIIIIIINIIVIIIIITIIINKYKKNIGSNIIFYLIRSKDYPRTLTILQVIFRFDGRRSCRHDVCGWCLSKLYIAPEQPMYCPKCIQQNQKQVSCVTYEGLIKTFANAVSIYCSHIFFYYCMYRVFVVIILSTKHIAVNE